MKAKFLKPGRKLIWNTPFGKKRDVEFVRREIRIGRAPVSTFIVPDFAGLNGPNDKGFIECLDRVVAAEMEMI